MVIRDIIWYFQRIQARRRGRYDGAQGVPVPDEASTFPAGEFRLKRMTDRALEELARHWAHIDRRLKGRYCGMLREVRLLKISLTETEFEFRRLKVVHEDNMNAINQDRKVKRTKWGPDHEWRMNPLGYLMFMLAILIGEFPLNAIAFRLFGEAEVLTYVMTLVLAVSLVGSAHVLGIFLSLEKPSKVQLLLLAVCVVAPLGAIFAIALVREAYVIELGHSGMSPRAVTATFILINLLIYSIATVLSYLTHDPMARQVRLTEAPLRQVKRQLARMQRRKEKLEIRLQYLVAWRQKTLQAVMHEAHIITNAFEELIQEYRMSNLEARKEKTVPAIFKDHPEFSLPVAIQVLDWYCPEVPDLVATSRVMTSSSSKQAS
ncbi:MAG: hypothetical protein E6H05_06200 [Bacillati bacterium ANGP1]|uniref:Uncharacterized protein n=1 Tax=Candidatus Segetimicrobium genomatis TaxID=2569760 RepID=A0A537IX49_9BACT|nr:MAG: hypothetical protein E6H05_06200 [Terrabacteria group bacterium ANGP1]